MELNRIDDEGAETLRSFYEKWLAENVQGVSNYEAHKHVGMLAWRAGDAGLTRKHLETAANQAIEFFDKVDLNDTKSRRQPSDFDLPLMLALAFGDRDLHERVARLPRQNWFQPEDPEYKPLADLFDVLKHFPIDKKFNKDAVRAVLVENEAPQAQQYYRPWVKAMAEGLLAIADKNKSGVEKSLQKLLAIHSHQALEGDWQYLSEGLLATWALVLYNFAREAAIAIDSDSPYFPKNY
jgi:hypothetical protein